MLNLQNLLNRKKSRRKKKNRSSFRRRNSQSSNNSSIRPHSRQSTTRLSLTQSSLESHHTNQVDRYSRSPGPMYNLNESSYTFPRTRGGPFAHDDREKAMRVKSHTPGPIYQYDDRYSSVKHVSPRCVIGNQERYDPSMVNKRRAGLKLYNMSDISVSSIHRRERRPIFGTDSRIKYLAPRTAGPGPGQYKYNPAVGITRSSNISGCIWSLAERDSSQ